MATRIETPAFTVPAGTPINNPISVQLYANRADLEEIEVMVPAGPSGLVGFRFDHSNRQVIPAVDGTWIITDDETLRWPLRDYNPFPNWKFRAYNLDVYPHTVYVRLLLNDQMPAAQSTVDLVPIE